MKLPLPVNGVSDTPADSEQRADTTRAMVNMSGDDAPTKKRRLSQRPGVKKYLDLQVNGTSSPVRALRSVTFQRKAILHTDKVSSSSVPLGTDDVPYSALTASAKAVLNNDTDKQGNLYSVDGLAGVEKRNSALELQWKLALPVRQETATVRALRVASMGGLTDADSEVVFAGVSEGGLEKDALMWGYKQVSTRDEEGKVETKTEQLFELETEAYVEVIRVRNGLLYTAQNIPSKGMSFVRVYFGLTTPHPELAKEFETPYPINGMDVRAADGAIITAHPQNLKRGINPKTPGFTARDLAIEWKITDLVDYDKRIWGDWNAANLAADQDLVDGDPVPIWNDTSPNGRDLFCTDSTDLTTQPVFLEHGLGDRPCVRWSGATATLAQSLNSLTNPAYQAQYDDAQKTMVPGFTNHKWAMFIVMRPALEGGARPVFYQDNQDPGGQGFAGTDMLIANKSALTNNSVTADSIQGRMTWFTSTVVATGEGGALASSDGATGNNLPFPIDFTGAGILCIVNDCRANSGIDAAQHSTLRWNGRPIDRWISAPSVNLLGSFLGSGSPGLTSFFNGDIARIIVVRDYPTGTDHTGSGNAHGDPISGALASATAHYPRVVGTFGSAAVAWAATSTNRYNDNEIERFEGVLAGEFGLSHMLPCGTASVLSATANPAPGDTVTIDAGGNQRVYTIVAALTGAAGEVVDAGVCRYTIRNIYNAINNSGDPGFDYSVGMTAHPTVRATAWNDQNAATGHLKIETKGLTPVVVSEASAVMSWSNLTTSTVATVTTNSALFMPGHYPHPFSIHYGYPRKDDGATIGVQLESKGKLMTSTEEMLCRWDPQGKIAWVTTSRDIVAQPGGFNLPTANQRFGGLGWDCAFGAEVEGVDTKAIYSTGQMYAISPTTAQELAVLRRMIDNDTSVDMTGTGTWALSEMNLVNASSDAFGQTNLHLRIAVDTFDNVYQPWSEVTPANNSIMSLVCVQPAGTVAWTWRKTNTATNPAGLCVAIDKKLPDYDGDPATRAFAVYLGTRLGYTTDLRQDNIYRIETVAVTHLVGVPPSDTRLCAVVNGEFWTSLNGAPMAEPSGINTLLNPVFATDASNPDAFICLESLNGHIYGTDGRVYIDYDGRKDTLSVMRSKTAGELKPRARAVAAWRGRLIWYRFADDPHEYLASAVGAPYDYDISPPVEKKTQAFLGTRTPRGTGKAPDIINRIEQSDDDTATFYCATSLWVLDGDPMDNGRFVNVSDATGGSFGSSSCRDEKGRPYFFATCGAAYALAKPPVSLSEDFIPERLRAIDFSTTRPALLWDNERQGFHLFLTPVDPTVATIVEHYFWSRKRGGWYPESFPTVGMQPTCVFVADGDLAANRSPVFGCVDGYLRCFDSAADDDDGEPTLPSCTVGPIAADDVPNAYHFKELDAVLATNQGGCAYQLYASDTPDEMGSPVASGSFSPGANPTHFVQAVGRYIWLTLSNSTHERFSIESLNFRFAMRIGQAAVR